MTIHQRDSFGWSRVGTSLAGGVGSREAYTQRLVAPALSVLAIVGRRPDKNGPR